MRLIKLKHQPTIFILTLLVVLSFQQCSKVAVTDLGSSASSSENPNGEPVDPNLRQITQNSVLKADRSPLDIILVVDNSGSMREDSEHLAARLENFVKALETSGFNWQMCLVRTDYNDTAGAAQDWYGLSGDKAHILNYQSTQLGTIFSNTISTMGFSGSGDERGVAALSRNLDSRAANSCYRQGSVVTTIVISDEDERSMGGLRDIYEGHISSAQLDNQFRALEAIDLPANLITRFQSALPSNKLISNSIIVRSGDTACFNQQIQSNPAFYGKQYELLSSLTGGAVGSICATDYAPVLSQFASVIIKSIKEVELQCVPVGSIKVTSANNSALKWTLSGKTVSFESSLEQDLAIQIQYQCQ